MEIDKYINPDLLVDNASFSVTEEVRHDFSEEEITRMKAEFFSNSNYQELRQEALNEFKAVMTSDFTTADIREILDDLKKRDFGVSGLKYLKKEAKSNLKIINRGYDIVMAKLYAFPYYDIQRMAFYDESGNYVYDRPMKPNEMQMTIPSGAKIKSI